VPGPRHIADPALLSAALPAVILLFFGSMSCGISITCPLIAFSLARAIRSNAPCPFQPTGEFHLILA
jgi:hypothetical protein